LRLLAETLHPTGGGKDVPEILELIKSLSRRPIEPRLDSELLADLGFDSLQVLELVGELEERFNISIPVNDLTHVRTVAQVVEQVQRLAAGDAQTRHNPDDGAGHGS